VRSVADQIGISKSTVARYFALFGLQPHRAKSCKLSTDPFFVEKVRDVVGLYLNPPDKALVLGVDEKSQIQALERTQPVLPMGLGYVEGVTHDYFRYGTTTLFAALDALDGSVITQCKPRHRHQEFRAFLKSPRPQCSARARGPSDRRQLRHPQASAGQSLAGAAAALPHPLHPELRQLAQPGRALVRTDHPAVPPARFVQERARVGAQDRSLRRSPPPPQTPFVWTATADSILEKLHRLCKLINGTRN
jgi:putative transposase